MRRFINPLLLWLAHGIDPRPEGRKGTWDAFIRRHAETLWACDYMAVKVLTWRGWRDAFILVFINIATRRCWV